MLSRNRPTGPRRGTTILILGAASLPIGGALLAAHFWVAGIGWPPTAILLARIALFLASLAWAGLTVLSYRGERRAGRRAYGATAGLILLVVGTLGTCSAMAPGVLDSIGVVTG